MTESEGAGRPARGGVVDTTSTPSIRLTGTWGIIAAFVVLTGVLGIDSWTANQSVKASEWVAHTYQVGEHLQQVLSTLQDAETGQRGFLLTGNEAYLEPFTLADGRVQDTVGGLRALTSDNPRQQQSIDRLEPLIVDKLDELKETIALRQADKTGAALAIVRSDRGKLIMDRIRRIVTEMESEEAALLVVRQGDLERATTLSIAGQGVGIVLLIGIAVVVVMKIRNTLTFHRLADEALRESETRYRAIFEQSPVSIWEEDWTAVKVMIDDIARRGAPDWSRYFDSHPEQLLEAANRAVILDVNRATLDIYRAPSKEAAINANQGDNLSEVALGAFRRRLVAYCQGETSFEIEGADQAVDGTEIITRVRSVISPAHEGTWSRVLAVVEDTSERHKIDRMKNEFVSTVSHELRTPLAAIIGSLGLVLGGALGAFPEKTREMLDITYTNSERLIRLINDILDIEKIEAGELDDPAQIIDAMNFIELALEANKGLCEQNNVAFVVTGRVDGARIMANQDRLMQLLTNLLSNDVKFSPPESPVEIAVSRHGDNVRIAVTDNGPGIPDEFRDRIFQKFAQADSSDDRPKGGTGLGLSICKAIVEHYGGSIAFDSAGGGGTTMRFELSELVEGNAANPAAASD